MYKGITTRNKTNDEIALEALTAYTMATVYPDETITDRIIRSRAYLDGFEATLIASRTLACRSVSWPVALEPECNNNGKRLQSASGKFAI